MNGDARSTSAKSPRHGEVDGRGHGVADAVDDEGGLVADNGIGTCPETSHHEILEALGGKTSQPVDAVGRSFDGAGLLEVPQLLSGDMVAPGLGPW